MRLRLGYGHMMHFQSEGRNLGVVALWPHFRGFLKVLWGPGQYMALCSVYQEIRGRCNPPCTALCSTECGQDMY